MFVIAAVATTLLVAYSMTWFRSKIKLGGKHVIITGGSEGLGFSLAKEFCMKGSHVTIIARTKSKLDQAIVELQELALPEVRFQALTADVTQYEQMQAVVQEAEASFGPCDFMVCNAGATHPGFTGYSAYAPTKYAVRGLADTLRNELQGTGVHVSIGFPADMDTPCYKGEELIKVARGFVHGIEQGRYHLPSPDIGQDWFIMDGTASWSPRRLAQSPCDQKANTTSSYWQDPGLETDIHGVNRVPYRDQGWNFWNWENHRIHYVQAGSSGPPIVLVHGFGASAYHWRYNIIELAKKHRVFAVDLLGFGWSDKALVDYSSNIWSDQIAAFIKEVVNDGPVVLAGNSLGGYNSLATAARYPDLVKGVVLLNGAGRIEDVQTAVEAPVAAGLSSTEKEVLAAIDPADFSDAGHTASGMTRQNSASRTNSSSQSSASQTAAPLTKSSKEQTSFLQQVLSPLATIAKRVAVYGSFVLTKQPSRVKQVLQQVYIDKTNVDDDLVKSIIRAAEDPNAAEVFYRVIGGNSGVTGGGASVNQLLNKLDNKMPMLLLWGDLDPWIGPGSAARVKKYYPKADRVGIQAGHCPHDEKPAEVDRILVEWADKL
ncbi:MAG: alpha beta fold family [Trebouxia sp. A1-2]|nr:MAG: alpha beta fold family [Trebouxia sp. A1-2]